MPAFDAGKFYLYVRNSTLFGARLTQSQVDGMNAILNACLGWGPAWTAYALATAYHETAYTMKPIKEYGSNAYLSKYDTGKLAERLGNTPEADGDGQKYAGRGYVQLTGHDNYKKLGALLGIDLLGNPDLALNENVAAKILRIGMANGIFTGKSLSTYLPFSEKGTKAQFTEARRIINGIDKATVIASYAVIFQQGLINAGWK